MSNTLLIELGCEELPAKALRQQAEGLASGLEDGLREAGLIGDDGQAHWFATPRRLAVAVTDVARRQADRVLERKGPAEQAAFDENGRPTRAAEGFARSVGLDVDQLDLLENEQGRWLYAEVRQEGEPLNIILQSVLDKAIRSLASARSMRWSDRSDRFLRPVRWVVALHGADIVELRLFGIDAGRETRGHRVHSPGPHSIESADEYGARLEQAFVVADFDTRRERIAEQVARCAAEAGLSTRTDPDLLDEVTGLVEWPVAVIGGFDRDFLEVPAEALVSAMRVHQKCFPLYGEDGSLAPKFITVANLESEEPASMIRGYERVIRPRLADARFFFDQDRSVALADRIDRLETMQFQDRLGSIADKTRRLESLVSTLAEPFGADSDHATRAARLCKCDLMTEMVGEFPELQGTMGRHYALAEGEPAPVADAIEEHYAPRHAGDALPSSREGRALAIADRLDTLVGVFAVGKKPKGSKDPFALRRAAQGVVRILDAAGLRVPLRTLVDAAAEALVGQVDTGAAVRNDVAAFIEDRLQAWLGERGIGVNTFRAVIAGRVDSVHETVRRCDALQAFADDPEMESLIAANKRAANLLRQADDQDFGDVRRDLMNFDEEIRLLESIESAEADVQARLEQGDDAAALERLAALRPATDAFFEAVMVMDEDSALRANRLALLKRLRSVFLGVADVALLGRA